MIERLGRGAFRVGLLLLPTSVRERVGGAMSETFAERQRDLIEHGAYPRLLVLWAVEALGLARTAYRARVPGRWARRTSPPGHRSHRTSTRSNHMDVLVADLRFALRTFVRRPMMSLLAIGTLSLGIGASTAMFSVTESVLLRPLAYPDPGNLYSVYPTWPSLAGHPTLGDLAERGTWSWPEFFQVAESQRVFTELAAWQNVSMTLAGDGRPERVSMAEATHGFFAMLGATPLAGRLFREDEGRPGTDRVVLLTAGYWRARFGGDPDLVGSTIRLDGDAYSVVGVLPDGFEVTGSDVQLWRPKAGSPTDQGLGNHSGVRAMARLRPDASASDARGEVERILRDELPDSHGDHGASVFLRQSEETRRARPVLLGLFFAAGLLLLVACSNVAALLLGAGIDRERELALRGAVGASRGRIVKQMLTESVLLSIVSGLLGIAVAGAATNGLVYLAPAGVPRLQEAALNPSVLGFALLLATLCGVGFGAIPAISLSTQSLASSIGSNRSTSRSRARLQSFLVAGELALATVLIVGAGLLARTVAALDGVDVGFDREGLVVMSIAAPTERFRDADGALDDEAMDLYHRNLLEQVARLPGVTAASITGVPPLFGWRGNNGVTPEGWTDAENAPIAERRFVHPSYLSTLGVPLVEGRDFTSLDDSPDAEPVVIVSEGLANLAWPDESAVGRQLNYWGFDATVIGVASNIRDEEVQRVTELAYYAPARQVAGLQGAFVVRVANDPDAMVAAIRERIWTVDPNVPITRTETLDELMSADVASHRYRARLVVVFAALAGLFSLMGVYGVTARSVARRTQEMGIRVALGARRSQVHRLVTGQALRLGVFGVLTGALVSLAIAGAIERFLWGVAPNDVLTFALVALVLPAAAAAAALVPAWRATRVSPLHALRVE